VSRGAYASLNFGGHWGDNADAVRENFCLLGKAADFSLDRLVRVRQVHGARVLAAHDVDETSEADGLWFHRDHVGPSQVVGVTTADCVPILLVDQAATAVAALHSGWRGTVANIAGAGVETFADAGIRRDSILAAIGPCIGVGAFEVDNEVAKRFPKTVVRRAHGSKAHVDLVAQVRAQLIEAGVPAGQICRVGGCTYTRRDLYFSYRRDGTKTGQHLSFIGL